VFPSTAASLFAFLVFVAPGFVYASRRERLVPRADETPFREVSSVALASLACSGLAVLLLAGVRWLHPSLMPDPEAWLGNSHVYTRDHWAMVARFLALEAVAACAFAFVFASLVHPEDATGDITPQTAWWKAFRGTEPAKAKYATIRLHGGDEYSGIVDGFTPGVCPPQEREIALKHPGLTFHAAGAPVNVRLESHERLILNGADIESMLVSHLEREHPPEPGRRRWWFPWVWAARRRRT
jgi:hypothetical protein